MRCYLALVILLAGVPQAGRAAEPVTPSSRRLIGYTELRTDLPRGRHANVRTMRAVLVQADGGKRRLVAEELAREPDTWTQFAGWSPDGQTAIVARGWQSPDNAAWEEEHKTFRFTSQGWLLDSYLVDLASGEATNVTSVERVSFYNSGLFFWPGDATKVGFTALIDGNSHPFRMDRGGHNKIDLTSGSKEFAYGFSSSRDGRRIAYHQNYQVYLADADGSHARRIETNQPFNFVPTWSPDGQWVLFLSGEHYHCHPYVVRADGTGLKKLTDRGTYKGVVKFLDVPDFHGGSSDTPNWSADGYKSAMQQAWAALKQAIDSANQAYTNTVQPAYQSYMQTLSDPNATWSDKRNAYLNYRQTIFNAAKTRDQDVADARR